MSPQRLTSTARVLRHQPTEAERKLWFYLRNRNLGGYKFRRQQVIGPYIADFFCYDALLVVEVDGSQHFDTANAERDEERSAFFRSLGMRVMRFTNREVLTETVAVADSILRALAEPPSP